VEESEAIIPVGGQSVPGTMFVPIGRRSAAAPAWVVLHGITVPGRNHPVLRRFARSLAASGAVVVVPEIEAWRRLRIDPAAAGAVIAGSVEHLRKDTHAAPGRIGVVGFSFGATQALISAAGADLRGRVHSVVGFGGYFDLARTVRFMMTGAHEWAGRQYHLDPDPYGRWIIAANYLTAVPEYAEMTAVADAAAELAMESGRRFVFAGDPEYDPFKATLRQRLTADEKAVWDLVAPASDAAVPRDAAEELGNRLVEAALKVHPQLDPRPALARLEARVVLGHGHRDQLIPFTETLRLREHLPEHTRRTATITRLFAHSRGADALRGIEYPLEAVRYLRLLHRALR
jgi:dienelactone hydrolase